MLPGDNKDNMPRPLKKGNIFLLQIINPPFSRGRLQKDIKTNCKNCQYSKCYHIIHYFKRLLPIPASAIAKTLPAIIAIIHFISVPCRKEMIPPNTIAVNVNFDKGNYIPLYTYSLKKQEIPQINKVFLVNS